MTVVIVIMFRYHRNSCNCAIAVLILTRSFDVISFLLRLADISFASRIIYNIKSIFKAKKKFKGAPLIRSHSSETSLFRVKYTGGISKLGNQDITGVFQSLTVKVTPNQFILDSLITLTLFQCRKIADAGHENNSIYEGYFLGRSREETVYVLDAFTLKKYIPCAAFKDFLEKCEG